MGPHRKGPRHGDVGDGHLSSEEVHSQRQNGHALTNLLSRGSLPRPEGIRSLLAPPNLLGLEHPLQTASSSVRVGGQRQKPRPGQPQGFPARPV